MDNKKLLGKRLQELRKRKGLKQEKLAELISVEPASISNIENGRNYPSFQTLEKMLNIFNVTFTDVFTFEHHNAPENLIEEINRMLKEHPENIEISYKLIKALNE